MVAVLAVAIVIAVVRAGLLCFLVVDSAVLYSYFLVGRIWLREWRRFQTADELPQQTLRRRAVVCLNAVALLIYIALTFLVLLESAVIILRVFRAGSGAQSFFVP
jgi:hypothetical protein